MLKGAERSRLEARSRPSRAEIEPAALELLRRHGAAIMSTARRFAATPEDAEDAYQRGVEILLTKAPTTAEDELLPWLRTVVKHEAWALRRQRQRAAPVADDGVVPEPQSESSLIPEQAERLDRLRLGAEAMRQLKPQEIRALLLRAEGYSYSQIQDITGWTYTKVNRCLTEGRRAFLQRVAGIEAGSECERLAPLLSRLVDGEAHASDLTALRPHLRTCLSCRAALREYRQVPRTAAALVPAAAFAAPERQGLFEAPARLLEGLAGWSQKAHSAVELASAQKVAAVAASTVALAGGGAAVTVEQVTKRPEAPASTNVKATKPAPPAPAPQATTTETLAPTAPEPVANPAPTPAQRRLERRRQIERRAREIERRTPPAQQEFEPAFAAGSPDTSTGTTATASSASSTTGTSSTTTETTRTGGGAEEFAP